MKNKKQKAATTDLPYLRDLVSFYEHVNARPPLHKDFDIREIDPEVLKNYDFVAKPFRHSFYCITLFLQGDITLNAGFWKTRIKKPALYFKTPCQIVSWNKPERWLQEYFVVFTEDFLNKNKVLADVVFELPFFHLEKAVPFEIEPDEVELLTGIYKQIMAEYHSSNEDKFTFIVAYLHTLLLHVRRLYTKYAEIDKTLPTHIFDREHLMVKNFRLLVRKSVADQGSSLHRLTVKYFADQLNTHPNHLNAVIKRQKKKTAIAFMHEQILHEAQSLLSQTELTIKEIAFRLGFTDSSHFNNFFKKQIGITPASFRKEKNL